jgi:methionine synthase II (cobalamin-independent)
MKLQYRVDHVGSFIRPAELLKTRDQFRKHDISEQVLREVEQKHIADLVKKQLDHGIRPITSGEFERFFFYDGFHEHLSGCEIDHPPRREDLRIATPDFATLESNPLFDDFFRPVRCTGKIQNSKNPLLAHWLYLRSLMPESKWKECKMTIPPPTWWIMRFKSGKFYPPEVYRNDEEYCEDLAKPYRQEIKALYDAGLRSFQIDDPDLTFFCHEPMLTSYRSDGDDPDTMLDLYIKLHNACLRDKPADMHSSVHLCRGKHTAMNCR